MSYAEEQADVFQNGVESEKICCICGVKIEGYGNNPSPLYNVGVCCDYCNINRVIPVRMNNIKGQKKLGELK